jgi:hypothetical protein
MIDFEEIIEANRRRISEFENAGVAVSRASELSHDSPSAN